MLFSVITVALNAKGTIEDTIKSVLNQTYRDVEYIVIDGGSEDGTLEVIRKYKQKISRIVSERDNGLYDAFNKGIRLARGDVIGLLNGDDLYANKNVLKKVSEIFKKHHTDSAYGDLVYVDRHDINKITRYWKAGECSPASFKRGWMAPHPTFFVKKGAYKKYGSFRTDFRIASDYEIILRFLYKRRISTHYIPEVLVKMRRGGLSNRSIKNILKQSIEDYKICKLYHLGYPTLLMKKISKIPQFVRRQATE